MYSLFCFAIVGFSPINLLMLTVLLNCSCMPHWWMQGIGKGAFTFLSFFCWNFASAAFYSLHILCTPWLLWFTGMCTCFLEWLKHGRKKISGIDSIERRKMIPLMLEAFSSSLDPRIGGSIASVKLIFHKGLNLMKMDIITVALQ